MAVAVVGVSLFAFSSATSVPAQIVFRGKSYGDMVMVTSIEVKAHIGVLRPAQARIDGKAVYLGPGTPPEVVALALSAGDYDAYQLSG